MQFLALFLFLVLSLLSSQPAEAAQSHRTNPSAPEVILLAQAPADVSDFSEVVITEGKGFGPISFQNPRCDKAFIKSQLGEPAEETVQSLRYPQYGISFRMPQFGGPPQEVRLEEGFEGRLSSNVSLDTPMQDVLAVYGAPVAEQTAQSVQNGLGENRTLYRAGGRSSIKYEEHGLIFHFEGDSISQIVLFALRPFQKTVRNVPSLQEQPQITDLDSASLVIEEGIGFDQFLFQNRRCGKDFIRSRLGSPASESGGLMNYTPQLGIDFWISRSSGILEEIRLNKEFKGRLSSNVTLATPMEDVFSVYGAPVAEERVGSLKEKYGERILYRMSSSAKIFYHRYGLLFWFTDNSINQIVVFKSTGKPPRPLRKLPPPAEFAPDVDAIDFSNTVVKEGSGFGEFVFGNRQCTKNFIKARLGEPTEETDQWMNYRPQYGIDFWMPGPSGPLREIRMNRGFKGRLSSNVSLSSSMDEVFSVYGAPISQESVSSFDGRVDNRKLYRVGNRSKISYHEYGLVFWFEGIEINQIVVYESNGPVPPPLRKLPLTKQRPPALVNTASIIIAEGIGFGEFAVGNSACDSKFIKTRLGEPTLETDERLKYQALGMDFWVVGPGGMLRDIRFTRPFAGRLSSNVSLSSSMDDVFFVYGVPVAEEIVDSFDGRFNDKTLYRVAERSKIHYFEYGLDFFFEGNQIIQIIVYKTRGPVPKPLRTLEWPGPNVFAGIALPPNPRWGPVQRVERLWDYVKDEWIFWFLFACLSAVILYLLPGRVRRLYYYWRPLPEGRLLIVRDPSGQLEANINIWYQARRLRKRKLIIGSSADADIRLQHESIRGRHAEIGARRFEGGVLTCIKRLNDGRVAVNEKQEPVMALARSAQIRIGKFKFQYEQPSEYRQVQVRYKNGRMLEGVPTSWDIGGPGFIMLPSRARSWVEAKFISFGKVKGIYFMRDWDEDVRKKMLKEGKDLFRRPATICFVDRETVTGYLIGDVAGRNERFYFFPQDQSGEVVYILVERSSLKKIDEGLMPNHAAASTH